MKRFHLLDAAASPYASTVYGANKRDALNRYRANWYPGKRQLPKGVTIWEG